MQINAFEIINLIIVLCSILLIKWQKDVITLLLILFFYGTLHFSFATIALVTKGPLNLSDPVNLLNRLHAEGGGILAKLSSLSLLGVIFVLLSRQAFDSWVMKSWSKTKVELHILLVMATILCGYIFNIRYGDWLQLKNIISIEMILFLLLIGYVALAGIHTYNVNFTYSWCMSGLVILFIADCFAFYEVFYQQSWAASPNGSNEQVWRANSILFNPNLFAYWAALVYLACSYGMHAYKNHRKMMLWGMVSASIAIYLSGSRSAGLPLLGVLFISMWLMKERLRWVPLLVLPLTMLTIYAGAEWLVTPFISSSEGWRKIALLGERFAVAPFYLISYVLRFTGFSTQIAQSIGLSDAPSRVVESIKGRFVGDGLDAGWIVLYQDAGWLGLVAVIFAACMLVVWGVRVYIAHPSSSSVYALAMLFYCLTIGLGIRFQIFPVWLFISIVLIPCLVFWRQHFKHASVIDQLDALSQTESKSGKNIK
jgi:hypothetical protein